MMHFDKFLTAPQVEDSEEFAAFETWYGTPLEEYYEEVKREDKAILKRKMEKSFTFDEYLD